MTAAWLKPLVQENPLLCLTDIVVYVEKPNFETLAEICFCSIFLVGCIGISVCFLPHYGIFLF